MPETIVNEHPVTIYPGRASPTKKVPPRTLPGLLERHRDVCRNSIDSLQEQVAQDNSGSKNSMNNIDSSLEYDEQTIRSIIIRSPTNPEINTVYNKTLTILPCMKSEEHKTDDEEFSDDSLEGSSLPPPPQSPFVPPKPSLSAPVTPSKRGSIAWEINLDENTDGKHFKVMRKVLFFSRWQTPFYSVSTARHSKPANKFDPTIDFQASEKFSATNVNSSQLSIASTPGSITSTDQTCSSDWPDPPEPPICSTEDEAGSIVTDSGRCSQAIPSAFVWSNFPNSVSIVQMI